MSKIAKRGGKTAVRSAFTVANNTVEGAPTTMEVFDACFWPSEMVSPVGEAPTIKEVLDSSSYPAGEASMKGFEGEASTKSFNASFGPGRRLVLSSFKGQLFIHIREYQETNGKEYPTKKGACFTPGRLRALRDRIVDIDEILCQLETNASYNVTVGGDEPLYKQHLGGGIFATINEKYRGVNLRRYWMPPAQNIVTVPTKNGIYLPTAQWAAFKLKLDELLATCPGLIDVTVCCNSHGDNQMEFFRCRECTPFGYDCV
jgi:hypothetical protein